MKQPSFIATDAYLATVNEILAGDITAEGAYCVGLVTALAAIEQTGSPPRAVLKLAAQCRRTRDGIDVFEQWRELEKKGKAHA